MRQTLVISIFFFSSLLLSGCSSALPTIGSKEQTGNGLVAESVSLEDVLAGNHIIAVMDEKNILLVDPAYSYPLSVHQLEDEQMPTRPDLNTFLVSPSHAYVVWYAPSSGVMLLNIRDSNVQTIYSPTEWFSANPYIVMHPDQDRIYFVDEEGTKLVSIALSDFSVHEVEIPYPFGTQFAVSPDLSHVVFVSGYEQRIDGPQYMFTGVNGEDPVRFYTQVERADREMFTWMPDSSGVVMIEQGNNLVFHSVDDPETSRAIFTTDDTERIIDLKRVEDSAFILTTFGRWRVVDLYSGKEVGRAPVSIAEDMKAAEFFPWYDQSFLIQEQVPTEDGFYNRLWKSDYRGVKKVVINKYHHRRLETETPEI